MSAINITSAAGTTHLPGALRFQLMAEVVKYAELEGVGGEGPIPSVEQLNAVLKIRTDLAKLIARLTAQIENVLWVDGPNREWLAGIIRQGILTGLLTDWQAVAEHLVLDAAEPVFIWASNGAHFPNSEGWEGSADDWEALGPELQWVHAEGMLRQESAAEDATSHLAAHPTLVAAPFSRELRPVNWHQYFFSELVTA
jgi:hypothetical protein